MSGPFESLDIDGLDDSVVCVDGVCTLPRSAEGFDEQGMRAVGERDPGSEHERLG